MVHGLKLINHQSNQDAFSGVQNPQPKWEQWDLTAGEYYWILKGMCNSARIWVWPTGYGD